MRLRYDSDGIVIYHGDAYDLIDTVPPDTVDLVFTDPPYGIDYRGVSTSSSIAGTSQTAGQRVHGDDEPFDPSPLLKYRRVALWGGNLYDGLPPGGYLVWDKTGGGKARTFMADAELCWHNLGRSVDVVHHLWLGAFRDSEHSLRGIHPTQKPVAVMRHALDLWTKPGDVVLDPFMGSGPIAQACSDLGRRYIGIDIVEEYVDRAIERLAQTTLPLEVT